MTDTQGWPFGTEALQDDPLTELRIPVVTSFNPSWCYVAAYLGTSADTGNTFDPPWPFASVDRPTDAEAQMLVSYLQEHRHYWFGNTGYARKMDQRPLDVDSRLEHRRVHQVRRQRLGLPPLLVDLRTDVRSRAAQLHGPPGPAVVGAGHGPHPLVGRRAEAAVAAMEGRPPGGLRHQGPGPVTAPLDLPPMPADADPVILPGLLSGLGITRPRIPAWITDPSLIESIAAGLIDIPADLYGDEPPPFGH
ncbi:hypothetical protein [Streptomyces sp. SCL15-4]|uniref:hypothetical protein n=1 Tax=Streptomyces sp. SCL15-4 TaxID=2967221 RepID=UPI002966A351|nr:hypothetical protein [Streptomyces sp. SCL15-4]